MSKDELDELVEIYRTSDKAMTYFGVDMREFTKEELLGVLHELSQQPASHNP